MSSNSSCVSSEVACSLCFMTGWKALIISCTRCSWNRRNFLWLIACVSGCRRNVTSKRSRSFVRSNWVKARDGIDVDNGEAPRGLHKFHNHEYTGDTRLEDFVYATKRKFRACGESSCFPEDDPGLSYCAEICGIIPQDGQDYVERDVVNLVEICTKTRIWCSKSVLRHLKGCSILASSIDAHNYWHRSLPLRSCFVKGHILIYLNTLLLILVS